MMTFKIFLSYPFPQTASSSAKLGFITKSMHASIKSPSVIVVIVTRQREECQSATRDHHFLLYRRTWYQYDSHPQSRMFLLPLPYWGFLIFVSSSEQWVVGSDYRASWMQDRCEIMELMQMLCYIETPDVIEEWVDLRRDGGLSAEGEEDLRCLLLASQSGKWSKATTPHGRLGIGCP